MDIDPVLPLLKRIYANENLGIDDAGQAFHRIPDTLTAGERQLLQDGGWQPNTFARWPHGATVQRLQALAAGVDLRRAADAFVAALGSGALHWQAVLPAAALGLAMPPHALQASGPRNERCATCFYTGTGRDRTLAAYFRSQEGSGWSDEDGPLGALLALDDAARIPLDQWPQPTPRDVWVLHQMLDLLRALPATARYSQARTRFKQTQLLARNTPWRAGSLLESLAFMGVLQTPEHPGLFTRFTTARERDQRPSVRVEVPAPLAWWTAGHGVNDALVQRLFGHLQRPSQEPAAPPLSPRTKAAPKPAGVAKAPRAIPGPLAAGDVYAVRFREDLWGAAYCHEVAADARGIVRGRMEYLDILSPTPPTADAIAEAGFRDRTHDASRWQGWCAGLDKTPGVKRIAAQVPTPPHAQPTPDRLPVGSAKDLRHLASWNFPQL